MLPSAVVVFPLFAALVSTFFSSPSLATYSNSQMQDAMESYSKRLSQMVNKLSSKKANAFDNVEALGKLFGAGKNDNWELVRKFAKRSGYLSATPISPLTRRHQAWVFVWNFYVAIMNSKINERSPKDYVDIVLDMEKVRVALEAYFGNPRLAKSVFHGKSPLSHKGVKHVGSQKKNIMDWGFLSLTPTEVADVSSEEANSTEHDVFLANGIFPEDPQEGGVCVMPPGWSSPSAAKTASNPAAGGQRGKEDLISL